MDPNHPSVKLLKRAIVAPIPLALFFMLPVFVIPEEVTKPTFMPMFIGAVAVLFVSIINYSYFKKAIRDTAQK
ncbi:hypothetical protein [Ruficoccus sp. ZRK36]|uniref:hypothetical protein n=1 Tax=Ruficoccus sp. ZRK36 TaxID=2866311 RepID=UPI001C730560|nr:hypothetical protein [Ruficoccus sp. ZRK36]QYY37160.1 hypothetical protein K0V07_06670 [Ruficoccus sp. ZRK36]